MPAANCVRRSSTGTKLSSSPGHHNVSKIQVITANARSNHLAWQRQRPEGRSQQHDLSKMQAGGKHRLSPTVAELSCKVAGQRLQGAPVDATHTCMSQHAMQQKLTALPRAPPTNRLAAATQDRQIISRYATGCCRCCCIRPQNRYDDVQHGSPKPACIAQHTTVAPLL